MRLLLAALVFAAAPLAAQQDCRTQADAPAPVHYYDENDDSLTPGEMDGMFKAHAAAGKRLEHRGSRVDGRYVAWRSPSAAPGTFPPSPSNSPRH